MPAQLLDKAEEHRKMGVSKSINRILSENLAAEIIRKYGAVNQSALSRDSGVAQRTIGLLLNPASREPLVSGKEPSPVLSQIAKVAAALNVEVWELLHPDKIRLVKASELLKVVEPFFHEQ